MIFGQKKPGSGSHVKVAACVTIDFLFPGMSHSVQMADLANVLIPVSLCSKLLMSGN